MGEVRAIVARIRFKPHVTPTAQRFIAETIAMQQGVMPDWTPSVLPQNWYWRRAERLAEKKP